ncbi:MAG: sigma 54-interacting transcriptional regulator [Rhodospirillales bacterium]|nr:sigma 54-interacting transcriptional regulator [Rhodospirillales bacterium]
MLDQLRGLQLLAQYRLVADDDGTHVLIPVDESDRRLQLALGRLNVPADPGAGDHRKAVLLGDGGDFGGQAVGRIQPHTGGNGGDPRHVAIDPRQDLWRRRAADVFGRPRGIGHRADGVAGGRRLRGLTGQEPPKIVGICAGMKEVIAKVKRYGQKNISVLITGATGTGKELVARLFWLRLVQPLRARRRYHRLRRAIPASVDQLLHLAGRDRRAVFDDTVEGDAKLLLRAAERLIKPLEVAGGDQVIADQRLHYPHPEPGAAGRRLRRRRRPLRRRRGRLHRRRRRGGCLRHRRPAGLHGNAAGDGGGEQENGYACHDLGTRVRAVRGPAARSSPTPPRTQRESGNRRPPGCSGPVADAA